MVRNPDQLRPWTTGCFKQSFARVYEIVDSRGYSVAGILLNESGTVDELSVALIRRGKNGLRVLIPGFLIVTIGLVKQGKRAYVRARGNLVSQRLITRIDPMRAVVESPGWAKLELQPFDTTALYRHLQRYFQPLRLYHAVIDDTGIIQRRGSAIQYDFCPDIQSLNALTLI